MSQEDDRLYTDVAIGETIYNEEGEELGTVRGIDDDGFYVLAPEDAPEKTLTEARELTGAITSCGAVGSAARWTRSRRRFPRSASNAALPGRSCITG